MKKSDLENFLTKRGYKKDRWGHYHKGDIRYKMQKINVRIEKKVGSGWIKMRGAYYRDLQITESNKLRGFK